MRTPRIWLAITRSHRTKLYLRAGLEWAEAGFLEIRPGHYMDPEDLTRKQLRSVSNGNHIFPGHRFGWSTMRRRGVRYTAAGFERS
jgi:hypothetical protein